MIDSTWLMPIDAMLRQLGNAADRDFVVEQGHGGRVLQQAARHVQRRAQHAERKILRKVSGEAAWRTFWPIQTPRKVGTMAATPPISVGGVEDVLLDEGDGQRGW